MTEMAEEAFASHNYLLAVEIYERCLKQPGSNLEVLFGYADSLAKCGRIRESIDVFAQCFSLGPVPLEKLRHLVNAILEDVGGGCPRRRVPDSFGCPVCEGTLFQPVTGACGHTACRSCLEIGKNCRVCGHKIETVSEVNVLVQRLVEKWWPREAEASRVRHQADLLMKQGHVGQALERYNFAVHLVPNSPLHLSNRANALLQLNRPQASLADADLAVRLRPDWGKGHYRRALALSASGRHEEALFEMCISTFINKNPQSVRHEFTRILHRAFSSNLKRPSNTPLRSPYNNVESTIRNKRNRHRVLFPVMNSNQRHRRTALNTSDCEDNSSGGEEEFTQTIKRRLLLTVTPQGNNKLYTTLARVYQEVDKLKRVELRPAEILVPPYTGGASSGELECILCCRLLWKPVTTPCGHTYCWMCLDRCLDYSSPCPLCITSLTDYLASSQKTVTEFVERALKTVAPKEYAFRAASYRHELVQGLGLVGSKQIAVFVCTTAFPYVACPLFVYEPRYRLMVRRCVESGIRQFGIAACLNREATGAKRYAEYGTILEIRDRVLMKDGCSILSTVGARRFRVLSGEERDGYDTAQVELLRDSPIQSDRLSSVVELHNEVRTKCKKWWLTVSQVHRSEIERVFGEMPDPEEEWERLPDGPSWAWWILAILPLRPQLHVGILGTTCLEKRLRAIEKTLEHMKQRQLVVAPTPAEETTTSSSMCGNSQTTEETATSVIQQS